ELLLVVAGMNDLEALAEESQKLILPLDGQWCRYDDEHALDRLAQLQFLDEEAGHNRLAGARIVGEEEPQPRLRQHLEVHGLDLMGQRAYPGEADCELTVVRVGQPDAGGLDEEAEPLRVDRLDRGDGLRLVVEEPRDVFG